MKYFKSFHQLKSNKSIFAKILKETQDIGYYNLPFVNTDSIKQYAKTVKQKHIAIIGIGGSTLGTQAIYRFLKGAKNFKKFLHFFESTDPTDIKTILKKIDINDTLFIVVSKSGTTIETISIFKYIASKVKINSSNCIIISDKDSRLSYFALQNSMRRFEIPKNVGGRFSVFSNVGLVPLAIVGVDIDALQEATKKVYHSFFAKKSFYKHIMKKARFIAENRYKFNINIVFSYSNTLEGFNKWYVQLWGESLGKINKDGNREALTPISLIGPADQHSFLQLIIQGKRDKTLTFIKLACFEDEALIPKHSLEFFEDLDFIGGLSFADLINTQADATIEAIKNLKNIACDEIIIQNQDEYSIAELMFSYQLLTSVVAQFIGINAYNQPGVEDGKKILEKFLKGKK